jgi:hypothetical protein
MFSKPPSPTEAIRPLLEDGEELLWYDQPDPKSFSGSQWSGALVGLAITAFALSWLVMAVQSGAPWPVLLIGVGIVCAGVWVTAAPVRKPYEAKFIFYAVTNTRLIIANLWRKNRIRSFRPVDIQDVELINEEDGLSDVVFGRTVSYVREEMDQSNEGPTRVSIAKKIKLDGFFGITDGDRVADLIRALKAKA